MVAEPEEVDLVTMEEEETAIDEKLELETLELEIEALCLGELELVTTEGKVDDGAGRETDTLAVEA